MKAICAILSCLMIFCLVSCSSSKSSNGISASFTSTSASAPAIAPESAMDTNVSEYNQEKGFIDVATGSSKKITLPTNTNRKIIYEAYLFIETLDFNKTITDMLAILKQNEGYVATERIDGSEESSSRCSNYELRVPLKNYSSFLQLLNGTGNVVSQSQTSQDVTSNYIDIEARLKSLYMQEERLLDMMSKAGELETLLAIQNQLTEVTYNIESYTLQKNAYDDLIEYSTVKLDINQVQRITEAEDTFFQRIKAAFKSSWANSIDFVQNVAVSIVYSLPAMIFIALVLIAGAVFYRKKLKKSKLNKIEQAQVKNDKEE